MSNEEQQSVIVHISPEATAMNERQLYKIRLINQLKRQKLVLADLELRLPYADGPAYHQDKRRIAELKQEITALEIELEKLQQLEIHNHG